MEFYDTIIVGGSFAGLSVASQLRGNILLIDRKEIGSGQTSACCTILNVVKELGCEDSILQEHNTIILHTNWADLIFKLPLPFCTFDYEKFCQGMIKRIDTKIIKANVLGREGNCVLTDAGKFQSQCLVDASGWRAILVKDKVFSNKKYLSFGIETTLDYRAKDLHFWVTPKFINRGVCWLFPCGERSRFGVGSYEGTADLSKKLDLFLSKFGLSLNSAHGGFFPYKLREPVVDGVFMVGDSAGQCMPLSGEGIREAIHFGQVCGKFIQKVIERKLSLEQAQKMYKRYVLKFRQAYSVMLILQSTLINLPNFCLTQVLKLVSKDIIFRPLMLKYETVI